MRRFNECIEKGLIKKYPGAWKRAGKALEIAEKFIKSAKKNFDINENEMCVIAAYNSLFHSSRALLFSKNYVEKSHFCLIIALNELYKNDENILEFLRSIDKVRISRHDIQYRGEDANKEEAEYVLNLAKEFLAVAEGVLKWTEKQLK